MPRSLTKTLKISLKPIDKGVIQGNRALAESLGLDVALLDDPLYFQPTDADYINVPVRMLTATSVQNQMFNFGHLNGEPLKKACEKKMFDGLVILKDHDLTVENWLGKTHSTFWDTTTPGAPAGVTGMMRLDKKSDPKVVRGVLSGMLDSVSVTIGFDYEPSHPKMDEFDFYMSMGSVVDGVLVQALVTDVTRVYELSLVWTGADQFAKVPGEDGAIHVPGVSNSQSFKEGLMDPKKLAALLGLDPETATAESLEAFLKQFAGTKPEIENLKTKLTGLETQLTTANETVTTLTSANEALKLEVEPLKQEVESLKPQAEMGLAHLEAQRQEALRIYGIAVGDKKEESLTKVITEAKDLATLAGFIKTFTDQADAIAPLACQKCGSVELSRKASKDDGHKSNDLTNATSRLELKRLENTVSAMHRP